ncbi:MAG: hypothetical protein SPI14_00270 [Arcanobacterium sp.]|nr:hypothetical protein [Arcanobacterium sp.]
MYGLLWRALPGPKWLKVIELIILALAVVAVLFNWVFPWIVANTGIIDNTVG